MGSRNGVKVMIIPLIFLLVTSGWIFSETVGQKISSPNSLLQDGNFSFFFNSNSSRDLKILNYQIKKKKKKLG